MADRIVKEIFEKTKALDNVSYIIYSNHGEVFDHFRYNQPYTNTINNGLRMIEGTSHGNTPYEVLYANMQIWIIPNYTSRVMRGLGRSIDYTPTVLDLAGITPASMDGESMLGHFSEGVFPARDRYAETPMQGGCVSMFRKNGFKFIAIGNDAKAKDHFCTSRCFENHRMAVFDLNIDPYEYVNLIETKQGQEVFEWAISRHRELKPER
jgi:arylsulfatase A-like enzyme